jgi:hypothetical protein
VGRKSNFTLLEIVLCVAILGTAAVTISWQMRGLLHTHHFNANVDRILTDLQKCQLIALSDQVDIEMRIKREGGAFQYTLHCDDPIPSFIKKPMKLKGIEKMKTGKKEVTSHTFFISSKGNVTPSTELAIFQDKEIGAAFKLDKSPIITLKRIDRREL